MRSSFAIILALVAVLSGTPAHAERVDVCTSEPATKVGRELTQRQAPGERIAWFGVIALPLDGEPCAFAVTVDALVLRLGHRDGPQRVGGLWIVRWLADGGWDAVPARVIEAGASQ
jgi:hypothetical protein